MNSYLSKKQSGNQGITTKESPTIRYLTIKNKGLTT